MSLTRTRSSAGDTPGTAAEGLSHRQVLIVFSGLMLGMLLAALDQTIVATALPTIVGDLHGLDHLSWVVTAYLLTTTLSTPLYGKISDLYGRKKIFQVAIVIFLVGSALSGLSRNMDQLIAFRALQGLGGGGLMALAMAIIGDIVSPRERGRYQGYFGGVFAFASIGGPLAGGFFVDHLTWRWIFYINIPVGILALVITSVVLRLPLPRRAHTIDYAGSALLVGAVTSFLLVTLWGGQTYSWGSSIILTLVIAGAVCLAAFVWWERRAREPVFPPHLFANPIPAVAFVITLLVAAAMFAAIIFIPIYLQLVDGVSPALSGVLLLPLMGGMLVTSIGSGQVVTRIGRYKAFPVAGTALMTVGMWLLSHLGPHTSHLTAAGYMVVFGLGMGMVMQLLVLAVQNAVARDDLGAATSAISFFRNIGAAFGTALFGTILTLRLGHWLPRLVHARTHFSLSSSFTITPKALKALPPSVRAGVVESFVRSLHVVFLVGVPVAGLAFVFALMLKEIPLHGGISPPTTQANGATPVSGADLTGLDAAIAPGAPVDAGRRSRLLAGQILEDRP
ncbi:MAG TPA: MDR family MFS transporter [Acidimicrobiales bacterium]|nr:MDR family MFS transporter [Acidimicrobiales bacterium]